MRKLWVVLAVLAACKAKRRDEAAPAPAIDPVPEADEVEPPPEPDHAAGGLAERGPHPDYPTAAAAGTDKLFFLEEPDRGPPAPATYTVPAGLAWTDAPYCEVDALGVACGTGKTGTAHWRVARAKGVTVVQRMLGPFVAETWAWTGAQRVHLDMRGNVDNAYLFNQPDRFTGRKRTGANALHGCGMAAIGLDAKQRVVERRCLQWLGDGMRDTFGVAVRKYSYDARGLVSDERRFGNDGKPVDDTTGVHRVAYTRDAAERPTLVRYFAAAGPRATDTDGCAGEAYEYDAAGQMTRATCIGADDTPITNGDGVTTTAYGYDFAGCPNRRRYLDARGDQVADHLGLIGKDIMSNASCLAVSETCVGLGGATVACGPEEPARIERTFDDTGHVLSSKHFGPDGRPSGDVAYEAYELRYAWDDAGNETALDCFNGIGDSAECGRTGFHGWRKIYDGAGRETVETFVDGAGRPARNMGVSQRRLRYDNYDHEVEATNLDADGKPYVSAGAAVRKNLWDATHRLFAVQLFGPDGKPAKYTACYTGVTCPKGAWHAMRINRRPNGVVLTNQFFDADGQLIGTIDCGKHSCFDSD